MLPLFRIFCVNLIISRVTHRYASKQARKYITHIWIKHLSIVSQKELIGISQGKDGYEVIYYLLKDLIPNMLMYDAHDISVDLLCAP